MDPRSCGLGTDLPSIDTIIIHDSEWNQAGDLQAIARARCLGSPAPKQPEVLRLVMQVRAASSKSHQGQAAWQATRCC